MTKQAEQTWDAGAYDQRHNFVWRYGAELIELLAPRAYPQLPLVAADARQFAFAGQFDAVFSNAVLHWILEADQVAAGIAAALRPGGR